MDENAAAQATVCLTHGACEHGMNFCAHDLCLPCEEKLNAYGISDACVYAADATEQGLR